MKKKPRSLQPRMTSYNWRLTFSRNISRHCSNDRETSALSVAVACTSFDVLTIMTSVWLALDSHFLLILSSANDAHLGIKKLSKWGLTLRV